MKGELHKRYSKKDVDILLRDFFSIQFRLVNDWRNIELKVESDYIAALILELAIKKRGTSSIDRVIRFLSNIPSNNCDVATIRSLIERAYIIRTHKIAGSINPFHINAGGAGNGTGKSGRN